jgi:transglutaminase-like putative cysteine protease
MSIKNLAISVQDFFNQSTHSREQTLSMTSRTFSNMCFLLFMAVALFTSQIRAAEAVRYAGQEWSLLDTANVLSAAADVTAARFPNCDEVMVDEKIVEVYHADGRAENQYETYTKVLTEKGRRGNAVVTLGFLLPYFTVQISRLEVIKPNGRVVPVDIVANSKESIDNSQMAENIYDPDSRILQVNVPGLEIGDIVHAVKRTTVVRPIIPNEFFDEFLFEGQGYIRHISCEIRGPASEPLRYSELRDNVDATVTATTHRMPDGTMVYHWEVNRVPRMYDEPEMPPYETVLQRLLVSTLPDWSAVSKWYWELSLPHLNAISPAMRQTVSALIAGKTTDLEKIEALFYYVSKNIRYMGVTPEKDRPGFEPHDVSLTFAKKYGVCRDKAALLVAMLRIAGLKAYPVLINVGSRLDPEVPDAYFNHAIAAVEESAGRYLLMDPTDEHTRALLPAYDDHQTYLVCRPEGEGLALSPVTPPADNMMQIRTTGSLDADGTLRAISALSFGGVNDDAYRGAFAKMKPDERRRFFERRFQQIMPGIRMTAINISPENMQDESVPLRAEIAFSAPAMAAFGDHRAVITMPWIGHGLGVSNFILDATGLEKRKYPLVTQTTYRINEQITLKLANNYAQAVSIPPGSTLDDDCVSYRRLFRFADHNLHASKDLQLKIVEFSPKQYLELKRTLKERDYDERKAPVMAIAVPEAPSRAKAQISQKQAAPRITSDARILDDNQELTVKDAHTAVLRVHYVKKILTYAGKIGEAEVRIPFNPATETARIIRAAVTSASGRRQEISKDEINVMDAAWNSSAERYAGGKILVDSLPGVEIGSTIDVEYEITVKGRPYLSGFQSFQLLDAMEKKSFEIRAPLGLDVKSLKTVAGGIVRKETKKAQGKQILQWQARNVGAMPRESALPPAWAYEAGVCYYVGDPTAYYKRLDEVMRLHAARDSRARKVAQRLAAKAQTKLAAVEAIRDYVSENVRPAGPSFTELPLSELSDADITLTDGYGHAADQAILLYAMLAAADIRPQFVLAADLPAVAEIEGMVRSFPFPDLFSTPLVRIVVDGKTYYLNDTDQYAHLGSTPHDGSLGIDLATGAGITIRAADNCHDREVTTYSLALDNQGNARIGIRREYYGMVFDEGNRRFSELRSEQKTHYFQEMVSNVAQGARPVGELVTNFKTYPGVVEFTVDVDRYGVAGNRCLYFSLPFTPQLFATGANRRMLPMLISDLSDETIRTRIKLPPEFRHMTITPRAADFTGPDGAGSARISSTAENGECVIVYEITRRPAIVQPANYPSLLGVESALENKAARILLLEKDTTAPHSASKRP